ncbi:MAG: ATP-binding protein [Chloroflexi bacterium]|nr:ATP-binding protein [Chloroflexota bacterium]MCI0646564.1 ATP-binding protein [Chloroflexota bacterium]MCI0726366.1 ATP-binding protein [Chloroflexota bacterium]
MSLADEEIPPGGDVVSGDKVGGDKVGGDEAGRDVIHGATIREISESQVSLTGDAIGKQEIHYHYASVAPTAPAIDPAEAEARLAELPEDEIPEPASLPPGSRILLAANPNFVGRREALQELARLLKGGRTAAIGQVATVSGLGGVGKTQLAAEFVHRYGRYFAGGCSG